MNVNLKKLEGILIILWIYKNMNGRGIQKMILRGAGQNMPEKDFPIGKVVHIMNHMVLIIKVKIEKRRNYLYITNYNVINR